MHSAFYGTRKTMEKWQVFASVSVFGRSLLHAGINNRRGKKSQGGGVWKTSA